MAYISLQSDRITFNKSYQAAKEAIEDGKYNKAKAHISVARGCCEFIINNTHDAEEKALYKGWLKKLDEMETSPQKPAPANTGDNEDAKEASKKTPPVKIAVPKPEPMDKLLKELNSYIGLDSVKGQVHNLIEIVKTRDLRQKRGIKNPDITYHMVFTGNPGTGKTTVARLLAKIFQSLGVLSKGHLVEVKRQDLIAEYVGQTAPKTQAVIDRAIGGVLFIDEAYSLAKEGNDYGSEAINTLLTAMEDNRNDLIVITAGYDELMKKFIAMNPGLPSRFSRVIHFDDYDSDELFEIYEKFCRDNDYRLTEDAEEQVRAHIDDMYEHRGEHFGNARDVRKYFEKTVEKQAPRINAAKKLVPLSNEDIKEIRVEDIPD